MSNRLPAALIGGLIFLLPLTFGYFGYLMRAVDYFSAVPGDLGDARFNSVVLEHLFRWATGRELDLWTPRFFYPVHDTLAFSDNHFGSAVVYVMSRLAGASREVSFDVWFVVGALLNYVAFFIVGRRLGFSVFAASVGAFVYAFAIPALSKEGHAQLTYRFAAPLAFLALYESVIQRRILLLWRVALWSALQFYCSIYLGLFLCFLLSVSAIVMLVMMTPPERQAWLMNYRRETWRQRAFSGIVAIASAAAVAALLAVYFRVGKEYGFSRSAADIGSMLPRLESYLTADRDPWISWLGYSFDLPARYEHQLFLGFGVVALMFVATHALWRREGRSHLARVAGTSTVLLFLLTLSIGGVSLYYGFAVVPGVNAIRAVGRIILVMLMPIAILCSIAVEWLGAKSEHRTWPSRLAITAILLVLGTETVTYVPYHFPISAWQESKEKLLSALPDKISSDAVLYFTSSSKIEPFYVTELTAMIVAQDLGITTINGYSGNFPPGFVFTDECVSPLTILTAYQSKGLVDEGDVTSIHRRTVHVALRACGS